MKIKFHWKGEQGVGMSKWKIIQRDERNRYECEYPGYDSMEEAKETAEYWWQEDRELGDYGTHYYEVIEVEE